MESSGNVFGVSRSSVTPRSAIFWAWLPEIAAGQISDRSARRREARFVETDARFRGEMRRTDSSMRFSEMRPFFTALRRPAIAASGTGGMSSTSAPAITERTAASPGGYIEVTPPMSIASVMISPLNCISSRNKPVSTACEVVAGRVGIGFKGRNRRDAPA